MRTFIDHLVEHFSQTPNHQMAEQWLRAGRGRALAAAQSSDDDHADDDASRSRSIDGELGMKLAKPSRTRGRMPVPSPF